MPPAPCSKTANWRPPSKNRSCSRAPRRGGVPEPAIAACLRLAGVSRDAVDCVAVVRPVPDPSCTSRCAHYSRTAEVVVVEHHLAHAASAFFASPFEEATVLTLDHAGDFRCGARWNAQGNSTLEHAVAARPAAMAHPSSPASRPARAATRNPPAEPVASARTQSRLPRPRRKARRACSDALVSSSGTSIVSCK